MSLDKDKNGNPDVTRANPWVPLPSSAQEQVEEIKLLTNALIARCPSSETTKMSSVEARLWALARSAYEEAAMWAVKAATSKSD